MPNHLSRVTKKAKRPHGREWRETFCENVTRMKRKSMAERVGMLMTANWNRCGPDCGRQTACTDEAHFQGWCRWCDGDAINDVIQKKKAREKISFFENRQKAEPALVPIVPLFLWENRNIVGFLVHNSMPYTYSRKKCQGNLSHFLSEINLNILWLVPTFSAAILTLVLNVLTVPSRTVCTSCRTACIARVSSIQSGNINSTTTSKVAHFIFFSGSRDPIQHRRVLTPTDTFR